MAVRKGGSKTVAPKYCPPNLPEDVIQQDLSFLTCSVPPRMPLWCSSDLRDGNQALPNPMNVNQKLIYFKLLCDIGFKKIEICFPSASQTDFDFTRQLIEEDLIPDDTEIMVLTQCREDLINRTFEALKGVKRACVHAYIATSDLHMKNVFRKDREETMNMAAIAASQINDLASVMPESDIRFQFSPEEFTDTDINFALEVCRAVHINWRNATAEKPLTFNLPATVERITPVQHALLVKYFADNFPKEKRDTIRISVHCHNDQGMGVAAAEMAMLTGVVDQIEGTLLGHGERTGNTDLITVACNLMGRGCKTGLNFSSLPEVVEQIEELTGMSVNPRHPYAGELVFSAYSGSHQDAIGKGLQTYQEHARVFQNHWKVPYLHVDPSDIGRTYKGLVRVNGQSGKSAAPAVLRQEYGVEIPREMYRELYKYIQTFADSVGREVTPNEVWEIFANNFICPEGEYQLISYSSEALCTGNTKGTLNLGIRGQKGLQTIWSEGNGHLDAFVHCLHKVVPEQFEINSYEEHSMGSGSDAQAIAFISLKFESNGIVWGVGIDTDTGKASEKAVFSALNRYFAQKEKEEEVRSAETRAE